MTLKVIKETKLSDPIKGDLWVLLTAENNGYEVSAETEKEVLHMNNFKKDYLAACKYYEILKMQLIQDKYPLVDKEIN